MPVSVVCDNVNAAIRDSIANSSSNSTSCGGLAGQGDDQQSLQSKLVASAKRVLLTKVEYEEVSNYNSSFLDNLKSKYMILKPSPPTVGKPSQNVQNDKEINQNTSASPSSNATSYNTKDAHLPNPKKILFPRENVQIGWRSSGRKWNVGAGMVNVGNTCYLNSTLQALFHVPAVANWLVSDHAHRDKCEDENGTQGGCIICAMSKTLLHSQQSQCPIRPHLVYTKLRMVCKHLIMGRQEDAHEFLRYLVEAMEKSYLARFRNSKELDQYSKETTPLNQILGGYLRSAVRCLACGHISTTFQHFEDLLLDIRKANTLDEALEGYFARERLEDMGYKCESCKKKVAATKQFSLERAPISLCIQLKRFSMIGAKLNKHVGIRTRLDLTPYATKKNSEPLIYRLVSMVTHIGSSQHCGHYTAIGLTESGTYYHFDDSSVRAYAIQNVLNTSAYIIFYELEDSQQRSRQTSTITSREYYEQLKDAGKVNGVTENNDTSRQYSSPSTSNSNPMHALNAKVLSKLDTTTPPAFIGPQLPDKNSSACKESSDSHSTITNSNTQPTVNGDVSKPKPSRYYLNNALSKIVSTVNKQVTPSDSSVVSNGTNGATNNNTHAQVTSTTSPPSSSTSQKPNQNIVDKLLNHLKAGTNPTTNDNANSSSNNSSKINGTNHESTDFLTKKSNSNDLNHNTKTESPLKNGDSSTHNGSNNNKTFSHKPDSPVVKDKTTKDRRSETPTKLNGNCLNTSTSSTLNTSSMNSSLAENSKSSIKSLVPYETDDEENDDDEDIDASDDSAIASNSSKKQNRKNCVAIKRNKVNNHNYNSDNESSSSFESYSSISRKKLATPSPPVVESKTGYWQVETISTPNQSLISSSSAATATPTPDKDKKNSFHSTTSPTAISPINFYSSSSMKHKEKAKQANHKMNGNNGNHHLNGDNEVVNELTKLSHRGYGAPVLSWNGHKSNMDKEVNEEKRLERKRELAEDEENEMDRGKQKKIKIHGPVRRDNPGYNPFQEYQSQYQNSNNRRWNNNGHSNNGRYHHNGHIYRQNPHHNHHNHHHHHHHHHNNRNHNNFRRHRFNQRPHHQRNGDSNSYHRRDS